MTNEQAIKQLKGIRIDYVEDCKNSPFTCKKTLYRKNIEALDLAIKALAETTEVVSGARRTGGISSEWQK